MSKAGPMSEVPGFGPAEKRPPADETVPSLQRSVSIKLSPRYDLPDRIRRRRRKSVIIRLSPQIYRRMNNAVSSMQGYSISSFCEMAVGRAVDELEKRHGGPFPPARRRSSGSRNAGRGSRRKVDLLA